MKSFLNCAIVVLLVLVWIAPSFAWWDEGHMIINAAAAQKMPASVPLFFRSATGRLAFLAPEPDRWKSPLEPALRNSEEPNHYLNLEMLNGFGELPPGRYDFYAKLAAKRAADDAAGVKPIGKEELTAFNVGVLPYAAMEAFERLKVAFREYRQLQHEKKPTLAAEQDAVFYAGVLGHYVGDAAQPLHATVHYNGWVGDNPNGYTTDRKTHANFEGQFVQKHVKELAIAGLVANPVKLDRPFAQFVQFIHDSSQQVEPLYRLEKAGAFHDNGTQAGVEFVRQRMAAGAQMLANLWYTAWVDSAIQPERPTINPVSAVLTLSQPTSSTRHTKRQSPATVQHGPG